jgi:hypothetical protein
MILVRRGILFWYLLRLLRLLLLWLTPSCSALLSHLCWPIPAACQ